jgi:LEA14-like dessication related protein
MKQRRFAALAVLGVLASACSSTVERPDISLEGVELGSVGLAGGTLIAHVQVHNPNTFTLRAEDLHYQLYLRKNAAQQGDSAWTRFAEGTYDEELTVGGRQTRTFPIPITFSFGQLAGASRSLLDYGRVDYRAEGMVNVHTPIGIREVPFHKVGTFIMGSSGAR